MRVNQVGRYKLIAELAQGGMGTVYLGVARGPAGFSKLMVIKQLRMELVEDPQFLNMFLEEARLAARLNHPNIVQTTEVGQEGNLYFLAMEYLDGQALQRMRTRVTKGGEFPIAIHVRILIEALHGLHYAHELRELDGTPLRIVHRDVSPHNVFVTYDGQVKVVDFGIAKAVDSSLETRTGELKGKVAYMPPEQASMKRVDCRADVFAVGVMLWEAIASKRMWHGMNEMAIMHRLMIGEVPQIRELKPDVDPELEGIVMRAISPDPNARQATAEQMANELETWLARTGQNATNRDVGRLLSQAFQSDREELNRIVEQQLRKIRELPDTSPSSPGVPVSYEPVDLSRLQLTPGSIQSQPSATGASMPSLREPHTGTGFTQSAFTGPQAQTSAPPTQKPFPVGIALGAMGILVFVAVGLIAAAHFSKPASPTTIAAQPSTPQLTSATTTTTATQSDRIMLTLRSETPNAKFYVDDSPVDGNPYTGPYKKDGLTHKVRVSAPGFLDERFSVVFDNDITRDVPLKKASSTPYLRPTTPPPPVTTSAPTTDTVPKKPPREIETSFPQH